MRVLFLAAIVFNLACNSEAFSVVSYQPRTTATSSQLLCRARSDDLRCRSYLSRNRSYSLRKDGYSRFLLRSSNDNDPKESELFKSGKGMTLMERIDNAGLKLKPMAIQAKEKSAAAVNDKFMSIMYTFKACVLFTLFGLYRGYRGFFVLLPAVFRSVYAKMETSVQAPFVDDDDLDERNRDIDPATGNVRFRTRFTVSILSMIVTASYVITGLWKVLLTFFKTITSTSSIKDSFEAAADQVLANEEKIEKMTTKKKINGED